MNHWPRAWYHRALENPNVRVTREGETTDYRAVPVSEQERERLLDDSGFPLVAYVFTGFAPRQFLRLDGDREQKGGIRNCVLYGEGLPGGGPPIGRIPNSISVMTVPVDPVPEQPVTRRIGRGMGFSAVFRYSLNR